MAYAWHKLLHSRMAVSPKGPEGERRTESIAMATSISMYIQLAPWGRDSQYNPG